MFNAYLRHPQLQAFWLHISSTTARHHVVHHRLAMSQATYLRKNSACLKVFVFGMNT